MMMDCERFKEAKVLAAHDEGRTPELDAHLASCASCRAEVEEMAEIRRRYAEAPAEAMSEPLRARLLALPRRRAPRYAWAALAAAAVLLAILVAPLFRRERPAPPPEAPKTESNIDLTFSFDSVDDVRASLPEDSDELAATRESEVAESEVDREFRELGESIQSLESYW